MRIVRWLSGSVWMLFPVACLAASPDPRPLSVSLVHTRLSPSDVSKSYRYDQPFQLRDGSYFLIYATNSGNVSITVDNLTFYKSWVNSQPLIARIEKANGETLKTYPIDSDATFTFPAEAGQFYHAYFETRNTRYSVEIDMPHAVETLLTRSDKSGVHFHTAAPPLYFSLAEAGKTFRVTLRSDAKPGSPSGGRTASLSVVDPQGKVVAALDTIAQGQSEKQIAATVPGVYAIVWHEPSQGAFSHAWLQVDAGNGGFLSLLPDAVLAVKEQPTADAGPAPCVEIERHYPCNLFALGERVVFQAHLRDFPAAGPGEVVANLADAYGRQAGRVRVPIEARPGLSAPVAIDCGRLGRGYYEIGVTATIGGATGTGRASLGVMEFQRRSAAETLTGGYRFGLGWWPSSSFKGPEAVDMLTKLGLQWNRLRLTNGSGDQRPNIVGTQRMLNEFPFHAVIIVNRFPDRFYDSNRYGPLAAYETKHGKGSWRGKTLPTKEPFQEYLAAELAKITPEKKRVFEIWNEALCEMSPEDYATLCQWIVPVILRDSPQAIVGPNLTGRTDPEQADAKFIAAGGWVAGMKMVSLHPYYNPLREEGWGRGWLRDYMRWITEKVGRPVDLYTTEYGAASTPKGPARVSELDQARYVGRQSLILYAEDCKTLIPYSLCQVERNPLHNQSWFGFLRKNMEPKPVLLAHANAARLYDGSLYVGELWFGPGLEAMLFRKHGHLLLALGTRGETRAITIQPTMPTVTVTDMFGREERRSVTNGTLELEVGPDIVYVSGLAEGMIKQASMKFRADRWPEKDTTRASRTARRVTRPPSLDGRLDAWKDMTMIVNRHPAVDDGSALCHVAWDGDCLYVAADVRDDEMLNTRTREMLFEHDSVELFVSTAPRSGPRAYGPHDIQFLLAPVSGSGKPALVQVTYRGSPHRVSDVKGARFFGGQTDKGWMIQAAIPWTVFPGFRPAVNAKIAMDMRINDADAAHTRFHIDPTDIAEVDVTDPTKWSFLLLAE